MYNARTVRVPTQLGTEVFAGTTLCVRAKLSRVADVVWHVTESKLKTNTCLCVGNVISRDTRMNGSPAETPVETPAVSSVFGHSIFYFLFLFSIHVRNRKANSAFKFLVLST